MYIALSNFHVTPPAQIAFLLYSISFSVFFFVLLTYPGIFLYVFACYLVLFPRTLSPKLPVLTLALANSSTSKQKTNIEQGIIIM